HQDLPFEKLVKELQPTRAPGRSPLFSVMLNLQNAPLPRLELPGLEAEAWEEATGTTKFEQTWCVTPTADGLRAALEYDADLWDAPSARRTLGRLRTLLAAA